MVVGFCISNHTFASWDTNHKKERVVTMKQFALKGDIVFSESPNQLVMQEAGYLVCDGNISKGVFAELPKEYEEIEVRDYSGRIIVPGLSDLHVHAPQYAFRGLGMDMELLEWLNCYTFPEEGKYEDLEYAKRAYRIFVDDLVKSGTTRVCIFATIHKEATMLLMEMLEESGIKGYVGKVSMDRNCPSYLCESHGEEAVRAWLEESLDAFKNIKPILTPRFIPSCTDSLMGSLAQLQKETTLPLQSHLSENLKEVEWVKELVPAASGYAEAYQGFGAFGTNGKTVMAHCVYSTDEEIALMKKQGVFVAHCPQSNTNLGSGIAPAKKFLKEGVPIGLGSDIAAGYSLSIFQGMADAIQVSKLRWRLVEEQWDPLTLEEAFYMGTKGGGAFFGKVGSFDKEYELDAIILDDHNLKHPQELSLRDRLERIIYLGTEENIVEKYVSGKTVLKSI